MNEVGNKHTQLLRVGELARAVGKTVRAVHLYEELGLVEPVTRTEGGFRLYDPSSVDRIGWIIKLQAIGFTLSEIQKFIESFQASGSAPDASSWAKSVFEKKLRDIRQQMIQLKVIENDLVEAVNYLESCRSCSPVFSTQECEACGHAGHQKGNAPELFAGLMHQSPADEGAAELVDGSVRLVTLSKSGRN